MIHTEKRMVERVVTTHKTCDFCGRKIAEGTEYHIRTAHRGWGNDSCDSGEDDDACTLACLQHILTKRNSKNKEWNGAHCEIEMSAESALQLANAIAEGIKSCQTL
jgi:hypothetical protein